MTTVPNWNPETHGRELGAIERGQADRGEAVRCFRGPASWSASPEARLSRERKATPAMVASTRKGGRAGTKSARIDKALDAAMGSEEES